MSVAHRQVARNRGLQRYGSPALWGPWYKGPKQRTQSHTTAVPLCEGSLPLAVVAAADVGVCGCCGEGTGGLAGLTHLATRRRRGATGRQKT